MSAGDARMTDGRRGFLASRELWLRIASAAVLVPVAVAAAVSGGPAFAVLVGLVGAVTAVEWASVTGADGGRRFDAATLVVAAAVFVAALWATLGDPAVAFALVAAAAVLAAAIGSRPAGRPLAAAGALYAGVPSVVLVALRDGPAGLWVVLFVFVVVWVTDIAAYVGGRSIGGPKLWPAVSPKKTWSGSLSGLAGGVLAGLAVAAAADVPLSTATAVLAAGLSIVSQAGDLAESALKRHFGRKDSGRLIPGHGGVMDRVDGLLAAVVLAGLAALTDIAAPASLLGGAP